MLSPFFHSQVSHSPCFSGVHELAKGGYKKAVSVLEKYSK